MSLNDFEIIKRLGEGAYSSVYHVRRIADNDFYALKKVRMQKLSDKEKENALNEVRILASIRHHNIVAYREAFIDDASQSLCIIMEYADSGDLFQQICDHQKNNTLFKEDDIWKIFIQMVRGLKCLHEILIFHRDLKSANVFLNNDGTAKLGDMNVSKVARKGMLYTQTGTPYYASPEVWRDQPYDNRSDIWSLGCVLYESIALKPPFRADDMQGLYKKVLRGVYPKIPNVYSNDLANLVKSLIQVTPQSRPSCERILEMPSIRKKIERLFPQDEFYDSQSSLLNTIRVPKNLLYLTDRLPKPSYESPNNHKKRMEDEEKLRRKTHDAGNMLPDIKNQKKVKTSVDTASQQPPLPSGSNTGKRSRKQAKGARVQSDMREGSKAQDNYGGDDTTMIASQVDEDRRSVVSKGSAATNQLPPVPLHKESTVVRKNSQKVRPAQQQVAAISHRVRDHYSRDRGEGINEEYEDEQFERDDGHHRSPAPKGSIHAAIDDRDSSFNQDISSSPPQQLSSVSPHTKRSIISKIQQQPQTSQYQLSQGQPTALIQSRPTVNYSVNNGSGSGGVQSVERIYISKGPPNLPSLADSNQNAQSKKNLAYINISGEGARPVGYLGLKKAEKDLIMRRYKQNHHGSDHIQRVALIYGNSIGARDGSSSNNQYGYLNGGNPPMYSPYLANQNTPQQNNLSGIIKRNKYAPAQVIEENSTVGSGGVGGQAQIRLPKLPSLGRQNLDHNGINQQSQAMLPTLGSSLNGQSILSKGQSYMPYIVKSTKLRAIPKPLLAQSQGISGEKININKYGGVPSVVAPGVSNLMQDKVYGSSSIHEHSIPLQPISAVSRANQLLGLNQSSASGSVIIQDTAPQKDYSKIYKKKTKQPSIINPLSQHNSQLTRNLSDGVMLGEDMTGEIAATTPDVRYE